MNQPAGNDFLVDLFREEIRIHGQAITEGLVACEQAGGDSERLAAMMRAAHSMKGASRVVNVEPAVEIAHAMEDCFVRAQKAELQLSPPVVDLLLSAVDVLLEIAEAAGAAFRAWADARGGDVAELVRRLEKCAREGGVEASPQPTENSAESPGDRIPLPTDAAATPPPGPVSAPPAPTVQVPVAAEAADPAPAAANPAGPAPQAKPSTFPTDEAVVRVTARSLTRLMGLAGESLVEARWLQPFSKSLLQVKQYQARLSGTLEDLEEAGEAGDSRQRSADLLADARGHLRVCQALLGNCLAEFDQRMRNTDDLSNRLYREVISSRTRPFRDGVQGIPRLVRDLARQMGKSVRLEIEGETNE
ncbi:MAG: Hpt domain-containing protein, partial [Thermoguttaceae bacterium]